MTNSTPKSNNKIERQGSPNTNGKRHRSLKYGVYSNSGKKSNTNGSLSCSPPFGKNLTSSPFRNNTSPAGSSDYSPTNSFYAGAKFSEPPSPASLPKPPTHWTNRLTDTCRSSENHCILTNHLKMILNVQA